MQTWSPIISLDHVLIATADLAAAKAACEQMGFKVVYGGSEERALNALIFLQDGTLVELIGKDRFPRFLASLQRLRFTLPFGLMIDRIAAFPRVPSGFFGLSLHTTDLETTQRQLRTSRIRVGAPTWMSRQRDDSVTVRWRLLGTRPYDLPFFIGDYRPSRLSDPSLLIHPNGAIGIASISIGCKEFSRYINIYEHLLGTAPLVTTHDGRRCANFDLRGSSITLMEVNAVRTIYTDEDGSFPLSIVIRHHRGNAETEHIPLDVAKIEAIRPRQGQLPAW